MKKCNRCGKEQPDDMFASKKHTLVDGTVTYYKRSICRECDYAKTKAWQKANPEKHKAQKQRRNLKKNYGLKHSDFIGMLEDQRYKCAICSSDLDVDNGKHAVDHNHDTGEVRGILCQNCNRGIGLLKDDPAVLLSAHRYLKEHNGQKTIV